MRLRLPLFLFICLGIQTLHSQGTENNGKSKLARVAFLDFYDGTGTGNFGYLPGSIRSAITQSMHKKFEFEEVSDAEARVVFPDSEKEKRRDKEFIKKSSDKLKADIIIFGEFNYDEKTAQITIHSRIFFAVIDEMAEIEKVSNPVDNTLFQVTEKVSDNIVREINRMLDIYAKKSGGEVSTVEDRKVINRESMETRAMVWAVGLTGQALINPVGTFTGFVGISGEQYFNTWFSGYGSLAYGFDDAGISYIKIPAVGLITAITAVLIAAGGNGSVFALLFQVPGILAMDGFAFNIKLGDKFQVAPFLGLVVAMPFNAPILLDSVFGAEVGVRLNYYVSNRIRLNMTAGTYYTFENIFTGFYGTDFSVNTGFSVSYLTGK